MMRAAICGNTALLQASMEKTGNPRTDLQWSARRNAIWVSKLKQRYCAFGGGGS